jgi:ribonuclease HI
LGTLDKKGIVLDDLDHCRSTMLRRFFKVSTDTSSTPSGTGIEVFTDGSKVDGVVGFGVEIRAEGHVLGQFSEPLDSGCTVFEAETAAINLATKILLQLKFRGESIKFYSDSQSALLAIQRIKVKSSLVLDTVYKLNSLARKNTVAVNWTRAHVGTDGNESADSLAKAGALQHGPPRLKVAISLGQAKQRIRDIHLKNWSKDWEGEMVHFRQSRYWWPKRNPAKTESLLKAGRAKASIMVQFMTGFNSLLRHEHKIGRSDTNICRLCSNGIEESIHLAEQCSAVWASSHEFVGPQGVLQNWTVQGLARFTANPKINSCLTND